MRRLNMPRIDPEAPDASKAPFEAGIGLALIACRIEERQGELARITLPVIRGEGTLIVSDKRFPQPMQAGRSQSRYEPQSPEHTGDTEYVYDGPSVEEMVAACRGTLDDEILDEMIAEYGNDADTFFTVMTEELTDEVDDVPGFLESKGIHLN